MDIIAYLVFTSSFYTSQQMKAYKSLQAYKYFEAGFVHKCGAIKINNFMVVSQKVKEAIPCIEGSEMIEFFKKIEEVGSSSALMRVLEPFASKMAVMEDTINNIYNNLYDTELQQLPYSELVMHVAQFKAELSVEDCHKIQEATKKQVQSAMSFQTSVLAPSLSLIKTICFPTSFLFKTKATVWGITYEAQALKTYQEYCASMHEELQVERVGLCLSPEYPQFGASPDGMVTCQCCGTGCVEVKCPYLLKELSLVEFAQQKTSCLGKTENEEFYLKQDHGYYYQVQMQMAILGTTFCDFMIWSPREFFLQRIFFDEDFWRSESAKALQFHKMVVLRELFGRAFSKNEYTSETWCVCQGIDDGKPMLCCDNDHCNIKWHHLECIGLSDIPEQAWYCPSCSDLLKICV
nr:unnamed protein product [Callosobruchus analis]